jgi:hypothetical protein
MAQKYMKSGDKQQNGLRWIAEGLTLFLNCLLLSDAAPRIVVALGKIKSARTPRFTNEYRVLTGQIPHSSRERA